MNEKGEWSRERMFFYSAAGILVLTGLAKLVSAMGSARILNAQAWLLGMKYRDLMVLSGIAELVAATLLVRWGSSPKRAMLLIWLACNFLIFRTVAFLTDSQPCPCLGSFAEMLKLSGPVVDWLLRLVIGYFLIGGTMVFIGNVRRAKGSSTSEVPLSGDPAPL